MGKSQQNKSRGRISSFFKSNSARSSKGEQVNNEPVPPVETEQAGVNELFPPIDSNSRSHLIKRNNKLSYTSHPNGKNDVDKTKLSPRAESEQALRKSPRG